MPVQRAGGSVPAGSISDAELASANNAVYRTIFPFQATEITPSSVAETYVISRGGAKLPTADFSSLGSMYLDPADYAVVGLTTKYRVRAMLYGNDTAPAADFTFGLYPVASSAGAANVISMTLGTVVAGSTVLFTAPSASTQNQGNSGDFAAPVAGYYALGVVISATPATNSDLVLLAEVQAHNT